MAGAEGAGYVVYQRGEESDDGDIWDDSALIKAYDNAVSIMKARLAEREGADPTAEEATSATNTQGAAKKKKKRHKPKKKRQAKQWRVGDMCRAVFSEDGMLYDAEIIHINEAAMTCTVRYLHYENEEDQIMSNLLPPKGNISSKQNADISISESDSNDITMQSPNATRSGRGRPSAAGAEQTPGFPQFNGGYAFPGMPFPPFGFPGGQTAQMTAPHAPQMPPPPPPPPPVMDDVVSDEEALSSMLISWYMSGYHTGYYQGLQQGKRQQTRGGAAR